MKILAVGDFHGNFSAKLKKLTKDVDLVLSLGDYPPWSSKDIFFEHCYKTDKRLWEIMGKKKYKESFLKDWRDGEKIMKFLNSLKVPVFGIVGNHDYHNIEDSLDRKKSNWGWESQDFYSNAMKKYSNIKRLEYKAIKFGNIVFIGAYGGSFPGKVKSRAYRKHRKKLDLLFKKYSKENKEKRVVFVTHNVPYNTRLDKVGSSAPKKVRGKHYGSKLIRRIIEKYQPVLSVAGHMHENQGKDRIGKTLAVNTGAVLDSKCAVMDFDYKKGRIKNIKFVK